MTKNRLKVDQRKSDAAVKMERPTDVSAVQIFIGLVIFFLNFFKNRSPMMQVRQALLQKWRDSGTC